MSTRMNIAARGLFATPVAALEVPGREGRNAELTAIILKKRETTPSVQASNAGGWHSDREIAVWGGPQVAFILDLAKEMANRLTADRNGESVHPQMGRHGVGERQRAERREYLPLSSRCVLVWDLLCRRRRLRHGS